jgi:hypothetical protein
VFGQIEARADQIRANGIERTVQSFIAQVPLDKITFFTVLNDLTDPQTATQVAINAGTAQPDNPPIPTPATPCVGVSGA